MAKTKTKQRWDKTSFFLMSFGTNFVIIYTSLVVSGLISRIFTWRAPSPYFSTMSFLSGLIITLLSFPLLRLDFSNWLKQGIIFMATAGLSLAVVAFVSLFCFQISVWEFIGSLIVADICFFIGDDFLESYKNQVKGE